MAVLRIVAHADSPQIGVLAEGDQILPGAVPGLMALLNTGAETLKVADHVGPSEFQALWQEAMANVWRAVACDSAAKSNGPAPLPILGYAVYQAAAQLQALGLLFDAIHRRHHVTSLVVDAPCRTPEDADVFGSGLGNPYYMEAAIAWARRKGIAVQIIPAPASAIPPAPQEKRPSWRDRLRRIRDCAPVQVLQVVWALLSGRRHFVFTDLAPQLPPLPKALRRRLTVLRLANPWPFSDHGTPADQVVASMLASPAWQEAVSSLPAFADILARRVAERCHKIWKDGVAAFTYTTWLNHLIRRFGGTPLLLTVAPFCDFTPKQGGFRAEAFRQGGNPIAEYQHGSNYTVTRRGMSATLLTSGLGDLFLEWNSAGCREHELYGLAPRRLRYADIGCPYTAALRRGQSVRKERQSRRILYAPTLLSVGAVNGINALWDEYVPFLDRMLGTLDASGLAVDVTMIPNEEMLYYLSRRSFTNLRFHPLAFRRLAQDADVIVADSLLGSPPYEAMVTDCPVIIYTGGPRYEFDPQFLVDMSERCTVCETPDDMLQTVRDMLGDVDGFIGRSHAKITSGGTAKYYREQDAGIFWQTVLSNCEVRHTAYD